MNNKQSDKNQQQTSSQSQSPLNSKVILAQLWKQHHVPQHYQSMFLNYIKKTPLQEQENALHEEIELTKSKKSKHFILSKLLTDRITTIQQLTGNLESLEEVNDDYDIEEQQLKQVCETLGQLRKLNYDIFEEIVGILENYEVSDKVSCRHYMDLFRQYDKDFGYLKRTLLINYIPFAQEFDPFLIAPSKKVSQAYQSNTIIRNAHVEHLLAFTPSQMFKLLKARNKMVNLIAKYSDNQQAQHIIDRNQNQRKNSRQYMEIEKPLPTVQRSKKASQKITSTKKWNLNNEAYLEERPSAIATPSSKMKTTSVRLKFRNKDDYLVRQPTNSTDVVHQYSHEKPQYSRKRLGYISSILKIDIFENKHSDSYNQRIEVSSNLSAPFVLSKQVYRRNGIPDLRFNLKQKSQRHKAARFSTQIQRNSDEEQQFHQNKNYFKGKQYPLRPKEIQNKKKQKQQAYFSNQSKDMNRDSIYFNKRREELVSKINEKYNILAQQERQQALRELNFKVKLSKKYKGQY